MTEVSNKTYKKQNYYLQKAEPINIYKNCKPLLDPYYLGLWLGDGFIRKTTIINEDVEVIKWLQQYAGSIEMNATISTTKSNALEISIVNSNKPQFYKNKILESLRYYNIFSNKDVPEEDIYSSVQDKLQLLAGFIDTDGSFNKRDRIYTLS